MDIISFYYLGYTHLRLFDKNLLHIIQEFNFSKSFIRLTLTKRKQILDEKLLEKKEYEEAMITLKSIFTEGTFNAINSAIDKLSTQNRNRDSFMLEFTSTLELDIYKKYGYKIIMELLEQEYKGFNLLFYIGANRVEFKYVLYT